MTREAFIARSPLRDEVYRHVLDRISTGTLAPGTRVKDTHLAGELGVSRTPVREALLRLAREGVLAADMGRGFRVQPLDRVEMEETGAILATLEGLALTLSGDISTEQLGQLSELDRELGAVRADPNRCIDLDQQWHQTLLQGCPN